MAKINNVIIFLFFFATVILPLEFKGKWKLINADKSRVQKFKSGYIYILEGSVKIELNENYYYADKIIYNTQQGIINLLGGVNIESTDYFLSSSKADFIISQNKIVFYKNVKIKRDNFRSKSNQGIFFTEKSVIELFGNVYFEQNDYYGASNYLKYDDKKNFANLTGDPYIGFDNGYIGGDNLKLFFNDDNNIIELDVKKHGDIFWEKEDKESLDLYGNYINIKFGKKNEPNFALINGNVRGNMKNLDGKNWISGDRMEINFIDGEISDVIIKGRVKGKYSKKEVQKN